MPSRYRRNYTRIWVPLLVCLAFTLSYGPTLSEELTEVSKVTLMVSDLASTKPTSGNLYRAYTNRREHVAEITEDGKPDRPVKCSRTDKFEAQADSAFDRPVDPVRLECGKSLAFAFTRMFTVSSPPDQATQLASTGSKPLIYGNYADIFSKAGSVAGAKSWNEAATVAAAKTLGDTNLDKFVYRDATADFNLKFTPQGMEALRQKQKAWGITPTGELDVQTQAAFAKAVPKSINPTVQPGLRCDKTGPIMFMCEPHKGVTADNTPNTPTTVYLPRMTF
jgi:hypothetical protein